MKEEHKVWIRGVNGRGDEVIKMLENRGGENYQLDGADPEYLYYINHEGAISLALIDSEFGKIIMDNYHELHLPEKWKDGDIIYSPKFGTFAVYRYNNPTTVYCRVSKNDLVPYPTRAMKYDYRLATPQEIEQFHELLHKHNKEWDAEKKQPIDWKWKPKHGDYYYFINCKGMAMRDTWVNSVNENAMYEFGNCFRTEEEVKAMAEKIKKLLNAKS